MIIHCGVKPREFRLELLGNDIACRGRSRGSLRALHHPDISASAADEHRYIAAIARGNGPSHTHFPGMPDGNRVTLQIDMQ